MEKWYDISPDARTDPGVDGFDDLVIGDSRMNPLNIKLSDTEQAVLSEMLSGVEDNNLRGQVVDLFMRKATDERWYQQQRDTSQQ